MENRTANLAQTVYNVITCNVATCITGVFSTQPSFLRFYNMKSVGGQVICTVGWTRFAYSCLDCIILVMFSKRKCALCIDNIPVSSRSCCGASTCKANRSVPENIPPKQELSLLKTFLFFLERDQCTYHKKLLSSIH